MKIFAEFYNSTPYGLRPACGDRSVIILDGRLKPKSLFAISAFECERRGYAGYQIMRGESFTRARPISSLYPITTEH